MVLHGTLKKYRSGFEDRGRHQYGVVLRAATDPCKIVYWGSTPHSSTNYGPLLWSMPAKSGFESRTVHHYCPGGVNVMRLPNGRRAWFDPRTGHHFYSSLMLAVAYPTVNRFGQVRILEGEHPSPEHTRDDGPVMLRRRTSSTNLHSSSGQDTTFSVWKTGVRVPYAGPIRRVSVMAARPP